MRVVCAAFVSLAVTLLSSHGLSLYADSVTLEATADTTLIEVAPDNNLGGADFFNAGTAGINGRRNRALIFFDLNGVIPSGATITDVSLTLEVVRQPSFDLENSPFSLRRVFQSWAEGAQVPEAGPGLGAPAAAGEATWLDRFATTVSWSQPGGLAGVDFSATQSGLAPSAGQGEQVVFQSTPELISDVNLWLNQPGTNFGWMLVTEAEDILKTARSFASRESDFGPMLTIQFTPIPEPATLTLIIIPAAIFFIRRRKCLPLRRLLATRK